MMKIICLCLTAAALEGEISAMELATLLHSGREDPNSPSMGVIVSKGRGVANEDYLRLLHAEGEEQIFHFLSMLGISEVVFADTPTFDLAKTSYDLTAIVNELKFTLQTLHLPFDNMLLNQMPRKRVVNSYNAARRLSENNYILKRWELVLKRLASPDDSSYINRQRTRTEESEAIYKQFYGKTALPLDHTVEIFDLTAIDWKLYDEGDASFKLVIPKDTADVPSVLTFVLTDPNAKDIIGHRTDNFQTGLQSLQEKYAKQIRDYSTFIGSEAMFLPYHPTIYISVVLHVQQQRRMALLLYEYFKRTFQYALCSPFTIYLYDPEQRARRMDWPGRVPFDSLNAATRFYLRVVRSFERLPPFLTSSVLRNVVLFQRQGDAVASVIEDGRFMTLSSTDSQSLLDYSVARESGHVADFKFNFQLRRKLQEMTSPRFNPRIKQSITLFVQELGENANVQFTNSNHDNAVLLPYVRRLLDAETSDAKRRTLARLNEQDMNILRSMLKSEDLSRDRKIGFALYKDALMADASDEFTSWGATESPVLEAAELTHQLTNDRMRAQLFVDCQYQPIKAQKVAAALDVFVNPQTHDETQDDMLRRMLLVGHWIEEQAKVEKTFKAELFAVVYVDSDLDSLSTAEEFVRNAILDSQVVSYFHFHQAEHSLQPKQIGWTTHGEYTTVVFGSDNLQEVVSKMNEILTRRGLGIDGRPTTVSFAVSNKVVDGRCLTMPIE